MNAKLTIFFYVALLPSIIYGTRDLSAHVAKVIEIAQNGGRIKGVFQPKVNESLGAGDFGFIFGGVLYPSETKVAMKFSPVEYFNSSRKEYEMYSYLNAINNSDVERYGIPTVYYYGIWHEKELIMMGMTLLQRDVRALKLSGELLQNDVNVLIIIRNFILTSKYMHSRGVRHDDVKMKNIMVRKYRSFLIDFNISSKMNQRNVIGTQNFVSRAAHRDGGRYPKCDWESFLYAICAEIGVKLPWLTIENSYLKYRRKLDTDTTVQTIRKIKSDTLRYILVELALHIFDDGEDEVNEEDEVEYYDASNSKRVPDYNLFYQLVNDVIGNFNLPPPVLFSWLEDRDKRRAVRHMIKHPIPDIITEILDPKDCNFAAMNYPVVNLNKFSPDFYGSMLADLCPVL